MRASDLRTACAGKSRDQILAGLADLSDAECEALLYDWQGLWARENQLPPPGAWFVWLLLAGRGFGKSRTGAEYIRDRVEHHGARRIALVGPTAADVRDVMVEGESGLLAVCPPWNRPVYEPSKRRLTWPNGAIATCYSADEPNRLRGPQHDTAWCLAGDTSVLMADGSERPLAEVRVGDMVATRKGARMVTGSALTKRNAEVFRLRLVGGQSIIGTADHPVWVDGRGFVPLALTSGGMAVCATTALNGAGLFGTAMADAITSERFASIGQSGRLLTALCRMVTTYTTSTATRATTALRTLSYSLTASIARCTSKRSSGLTVSGQFETRKPLCGATVKRASMIGLSFASFAPASSEAAQSIRPGSVRRVASRLLDRARSAAIGVFANIVATLTTQPAGFSGIAQSGVITSRLRHGRPCALIARSPVHLVVPCLGRLAQTPSSANARALSLSMLKIVSVERLERRADVYDIAVDDAREFFANGILVHNCDELAAWRYADEAWDMLMFGLRLGGDPRVVVTTTPRPTKIVKALVADVTTATTRGSTYDNAGNLAPTFLAKVRKKYEGTRLGRQELNAEILDDNPHALWQRGRIDELRVTQHPDLVVAVTGVDPAATSGEDSAETGIIGFGIGWCSCKGAPELHGFVLEDASLRGSPGEWGAAAVTTHHKIRGDRVVGEVNNGGEMVGHVVQTAGPLVPFRKVYASRGKATRAEPIAALYEQGRIHHVGVFPELEDQMCEWQPGMTSPDRLDAMVWAATDAIFGMDEVEETVEHYEPMHISPY